MTNEHFRAAMQKCAPSSLRDKAVEIPDVSWADVGGLLDVKREMVETLQYPLKFAAKYERYGMSPSKGMLLYGPSGCGKTLVAKAIANEVQSHFISSSLTLTPTITLTPTPTPIPTPTRSSPNFISS